MDIKTFFKEFKENFVLFTLGSYGVGLLFSIIYYHQFNIPIIYYIDLNDLLLFAISIVIPLVVIIFLLDYIFFVLFSKLVTYLIFLIFKKKMNSILVENWTFVVFAALIVLIPKWFSGPFNSFPYLMFYIFMIPIGIRIKKNIISKQYEILTFEFLILLFAFCLAIFSLTWKAEYETSSSYLRIENKENSEIIDTGKSYQLSYVGETSSNIFIYDKILKTSKIYPKDNISYITYFSERIIVPETEKFYDTTLDEAEDWNSEARKKNEIWLKDNNDKTFVIYFKQNPKGIRDFFIKLEKVAHLNDINIQNPDIDNSFYTSETKYLDDYEKLDIAIRRDAAEFFKIWSFKNYSMMACLTSKAYMIGVKYETKKSK